MKLNVENNVMEVLRDFNDVKNKNIPFAIAGAINDTLFEMRQELPGTMKKTFQSPKPFTTNPTAWSVKKAKQTLLSGEIKLKDIQAGYLQWQAYGGTEHPKKRSIPVPKETSRASHGGLKTGWKKMMDDKQRYFSGVPRGGGRPGIYKRLGMSKSTPGGKKLRLEVGWKSRRTTTTSGPSRSRRTRLSDERSPQTSGSACLPRELTSRHTD